jgi:hypothetical protein
VIREPEPQPCSWGFRDQSCSRPTLEVFCRGHRAVVEHWISQARQAVAAIDLARRELT